MAQGNSTILLFPITDVLLSVFKTLTVDYDDGEGSLLSGYSRAGHVNQPIVIANEPNP